MFIREYQSSDCKELTKLFYNTVHTVNAKDYTEVVLCQDLVQVKMRFSSS